ncbi:HAD-IA family hydrolase [Phaeovibrio sulfidiphilus]|uniref:HAD-IA family hydrolase n=1 Tax=Phaeovibrio sulfidiphilus TaxID=1220600 RepID=A0A8J6YPD0_9PROT|nr:HAD-IA family hydrolase [Phaeovibrio sulfidiphilus]MBE1237121.1 HAD-IA family hydrolase [Phaeovibrio sulfidiphilus]
MALELVVWDVDGTLVDSRQFILDTMTESFRRCELEVPSIDRISAIIGLSLTEGIEHLLPEPQKARAREVTDVYRDIYFTTRARPDFQEDLFAGMAKILDDLEKREIPMAIATGKSRRGVEAFLKRFDLEGRFVSVCTPDDGPGKPNPWMIREALDVVGADPARSVMIGDAVYDMQMAVSAGVVGIGVSWGNQPPEALKSAGAYVVAGNAAGLESLLDMCPWEGRYVAK